MPSSGKRTRSALESLTSWRHLGDCLDLRSEAAVDRLPGNGRAPARSRRTASAGGRGRRPRPAVASRPASRRSRGGRATSFDSACGSGSQSRTRACPRARRTGCDRAQPSRSGMNVAGRCELDVDAELVLAASRAAAAASPTRARARMSTSSGHGAPADEDAAVPPPREVADRILACSPPSALMKRPMRLGVG